MAELVPMRLEMILLPVVGALIGWTTNVIAIKMIFRPRHPLRIPFTRMTIQGLLPRRKDELAAAIARAVENDLLPLDELVDHVASPKFKSAVAAALTAHARRRVREMLPGFLPRAFSKPLARLIDELIERETDILTEQMESRLGDLVSRHLSLGQFVEDKLLSFDTERLESMVLSISHTELRYIEYFGAFVGFLVGLLQVGVLALLRAAA